MSKLNTIVTLVAITLLIAGGLALTAGAFVLAGERSGNEALAWTLFGVAGVLATAGLAGGVVIIHIARGALVQARRGRQTVNAVSRRVDLIAAEVVRTRRASERIERTTAMSATREDVKQVRSSVAKLQSSMADRSQLERLLESSSKRTIAETTRRSAAETTRIGQGIYDQLDGLVALYSILHPVGGLPPLSRWAIGPDLGVHLVRHVIRERPAHVVEFGSGVSTLLLAMAARQAGTGTVTSFDHQVEFANRTRSLLHEYGVSELAVVHYAPLIDTEIGGSVSPWYDLTGIELPEKIDLLIVDGPPATSGPQARYPAVPKVRERLAPDCVVVLDDADRPDEGAIAQRWVDEHGLVIIRRLRHAKGTIELGVPPVV